MTIALFAWNRLPIIVVAFSSALLLWATNVITLHQALAGFGDPAVIFIASLFVVSAALEKTGVTAWGGQFLIVKAGENGGNRLVVIMMAAAGFLAALISSGGATAALMPVAVMAATRLRQSPAQILIPLAFAGNAGANLLLTGAPKNFLVAEALDDAGLRSFSFWEFAYVGLPLLAGTMLIVLLLGKRLLPQQTRARLPADFSRHAQTLVEHYGLNGNIFRLRVRDSSACVGLNPAELALTISQQLRIMAIHDGISGLPLRDERIAVGDHLLVYGDAEEVANLAARMRLALRQQAGDDEKELAMLNSRFGLAEVVIPPRSALIGRPMYPGMATDGGDLIVLAVQRAGVDIPPGNSSLMAGDTILLEGSWEALDLQLDDPDLLVVNSPDLVRRQAVSMGAGAGLALAVLAGFVAMLATGIVPAVVAGLISAGILLVANVLTVDEAYREINWTTVILVGAMMPLSTAMMQSGAAQLAASHLVSLVGALGPMALLAGLFFVSASLGQVMSNTATTMMIIPIGMKAAETMGVSPHPVLMSVCVAGAAAFLTPIATTSNMIVMGPGGYAFGDYWKLGLPLVIWFFVVAVFLVPLIWKF